MKRILPTPGTHVRQHTRLHLTCLFILCHGQSSTCQTHTTQPQVLERRLPHPCAKLRASQRGASVRRHVTRVGEWVCVGVGLDVAAVRTPNSFFAQPLKFILHFQLSLLPSTSESMTIEICHGDPDDDLFAQCERRVLAVMVVAAPTLPQTHTHTHTHTYKHTHSPTPTTRLQVQ